MFFVLYYMRLNNCSQKKKNLENTKIMISMTWVSINRADRKDL